MNQVRFSLPCCFLAHQSPDDGKHSVRACIGNGLRRDIWDEFQERFKIPLIVEFYAATEGNAGFINFLNKTGSCGRASPFLVGTVLSACS